MGPNPGRPGVGHPQGVFCVFRYNKLVMLFLNMVCLTVGVALACNTIQFNLISDTF
jgi:hypothetical protein